jgi:hypothetical protein
MVDKAGTNVLNKHCVFHCSKAKTIHGSTPVQIIIYLSFTKGLCTLITHVDDFNLVVSICAN